IYKKESKLDNLTDSIYNAISFIKNPENNLTQLSENHRYLVSKYLLRTIYNKTEYFQNLKEHFKQKLSQYKLKNQDNLGLLISLFLYCDDIKEIWNVEEQTEKNNGTKTGIEVDTVLKDKKQTQPLNQILYGPPGTGKTYNTINKALEIIFENASREDLSKKFTIVRKKDDKREKEISYKDAVENDDRVALTSIFEYFKDEQRGQIEFVTFHQSYGYEEFVEGIKAKTSDKAIEYEIEAGIFKKLCEKAKTIKSEKTSIYDFAESVNIWKVSLGDSQNSEDEYLFDYCIENNKILLGFGDGIDFQECANREAVAKKLNDTEKYSYPPSAVNTLKNKMKIGDIVLISYGNRKLRAIAKITGEYKHLEDDNLKTYVQSRDVEWLLVPNEPFSYEKVLKKQFSQMTIYDIKSNVKIEELRALLTKESSSDANNDRNYIFIIDEINRGNISKIFGELITLIEPSKRIGADEEIKVKIPYSNDDFGVPSNLYIIGTMNTADRSIAPIDTALRRRFVFEEMAPKAEFLTKEKIPKIYTEVDLQLLLKAINTRIEYLYDRDHTIGHAYLIDVKSLDDLKFAFKNKIIPLLAEYFYEDWENIDLVLNKNGMIEEEEEKTNSDYLKNISKINGKKIYKVSDNNWDVKNFQKIYNDDALS
ncbi:MAG: 5-methylcytosine-specific restriction enzyme, partial [Campylobacterota bacterium]|nr:5-methylcytosine-specific restriction enzyme [Campylobacterota bacterium]